MHGGNGETGRKSRSLNSTRIPTRIFHIQMDAGIKSLANPSFPTVAFLFESGIMGMVGDGNVMPLPKWTFLPGVWGGGVTVFVFLPSTLLGVVCHRLRAIMGFLPAADCNAFINFHRFSCISNSDCCEAQTYFPPEIKVREKTEPIHSFFSSKQQKHKNSKNQRCDGQPTLLWLRQLPLRVFGVKPQGFGQ